MLTLVECDCDLYLLDGAGNTVLRTGATPRQFERLALIAATLLDWEEHAPWTQRRWFIQLRVSNDVHRYLLIADTGHLCGVHPTFWLAVYHARQLTGAPLSFVSSRVSAPRPLALVEDGQWRSVSFHPLGEVLYGPVCSGLIPARELLPANGGEG